VLGRFGSGAKLPVTAYTSDNTRQIATGALYAISNQMATSTGTVTLRADFPNADEALFPSEFVNIKVLVDTLQQAVLVPTPAVLTGAPGDYVYLVNANNTVSVHKVMSGPSDGKNTAILSGLSPDDKVVTEGTDRLSDGAKITVAGANGTSGAGLGPESQPARNGPAQNRKGGGAAAAGASGTG
jgi:membrane fusion protein, multidrug efflux system